MKKVLFYLPVALVCGVLVYLLYALGNRFADFWPIFLAQLGVIAVFLASAILLDKGRWYGCLPEIVLGIWLICMGVRNASPVMNQPLMGIVLAAYYVICGVVSCQRKEGC